jgi:hypothetical protein
VKSVDAVASIIKPLRAALKRDYINGLLGESGRVTFVKTRFLTNQAFDGLPGVVKNRSILIPGSRRTNSNRSVHAAPNPDDGVATSEIR